MSTTTRDIDRGWAWVVLVSSMTAQVITGTLGISVGLFQPAFISHFDSSYTYIGLVCSIHMSLLQTIGPVAGVLCNVIGMRSTMMTGGVLLSLGLICASFATSVAQLLGLYGLMAGFGLGISFTSETVVLGHYFHRRRALANGIAVAAFGIGAGPGSSLMLWIIERYGWRTALVVLAAISLQKVVIGSMYFPLDNKVDSVSSSRKEDSVSGKCRAALSRLWFLASPRCWLLCLTYGISLIGFSIHVVHLPSYVLAQGLSPNQLSSLITVFGVMIVLSRLLGGFLCNDSSTDLLIVLFGTLGLYGLTMVLMPLFSKTYASLMFFQVTMCFFYGAGFVPITPLIVQMFGVDNLATVYGCVLMWGGLGLLAGPVIAGALYDLTSSQKIVFHVGGSTVLLSAMLPLLIPVISKQEDVSPTANLQKLLHEDHSVVTAHPPEPDIICGIETPGEDTAFILKSPVTQHRQEKLQSPASDNQEVPA